MALRERLTAGISPLRGDRDEEEQARWLLAYMLDWHWREDTPWAEDKMTPVKWIPPKGQLSVV